MRFRWQDPDDPGMQNTPVPVLTVAGGHDLGYPAFPPGIPVITALLNLVIQPGFDDGTVPMDSSCAKDTPWLLWPSGFYPQDRPLGFLRLFDLGMRNAGSFPFITAEFGRASKYLYSQTVEPLGSLTLPFPRSAAGCIPYKSPWGMIEPVGVLPSEFDPLARLLNHYSFLQTSEDHSGDLGGEAYLFADPPHRTEETRAITNDKVYTLGLVDSAMKTIEEEELKGRKITFRLPPVIGKKREWWIWKRTYHRPEGWGARLGNDYVYDHVLK